MTRDLSELPWKIRLSVLAGGGVLKALSATWRYRAINDEPVKKLRKSKTPILFALWHGQMLPLLWYHRDQGVAVVVSEHSDGEIIARILEWMGYRLIRGSTSRGADRALLGIVRTLKDGNDVAITPDGPRGPARKFAPGAVVASNRAAAPIVPAVAHVDKMWTLSSWDGFQIPRPFARITIAYGPPTIVEAANTREAAAQAPLFESMMGDALEVACAS
ncbi:MAG: lysophospholipid acyltransferase family protein [Gemmatimonadaceae bacterium]